MQPSTELPEAKSCNALDRDPGLPKNKTSNQKANSSQAKLKEISRLIVDSWPDCYAMARSAAGGILRQHGITHVKPDKVYWHRFSNAVSSVKTFSGWEHYGVPEESMTLTELVMRRFRASDQDNIDTLQVMGGFYRADANAGTFNESNELKLLPSQVQKTLWEIDLSEQYEARLKRFWRDNAQNVRTLARANCLAAAVMAHDCKRLSGDQLQMVKDGLGGGLSLPPDLQQLEASAAPVSTVTVAKLVIAGRVSQDILHFSKSGASQLLYIPGKVAAFEAFSNDAELYSWLRKQVAQPKQRERLKAHFTSQGLQSTAEDKQLDNALVQLVDAADEVVATKIQFRVFTTDVFALLRDELHQQMLVRADELLRSNNEIRVQMWTAYLHVLTGIASSLAPLGWPAALVAVTAGTANVALNVEQAIDGDNRDERKAAVLAAIFSAIDVLFNLPMLAGTGNALIEEVEPLVAVEQDLSAEGQAIVDEDLRQMLEPYEANVELEPVGDVRNQTMYILDDHRFYIRLNGMNYQVRYLSGQQHWAIIDPANPYSFDRNVLVRMTEEGQWQVIDKACLRGGGQCLGAMPQVAAIDYSSFDVPVGEYEVPEVARPAVSELLEYRNRRMLTGDFYDGESGLVQTSDSFIALRRRLVEDAREYWRSGAITADRPVLPSLQPAVAAKDLFETLLTEYRGVVIGESHQAIASKQFLIANMKLLAKRGVRTLYMEHLLGDLHQADLDALFKTGKMSARLDKYLKSLDQGQRTDPTGVNTFANVVRAAQRQRIRVRALDCAVSYRLEGIEEPGSPVRQQVFSFYGSKVMRAEQATNTDQPWVALVGNTHSNTYKRITGLAELNQGVGLRVIDVGGDQAIGVSVDPGEYYLPSIRSPDGVVKADYLLAIKTKPEAVEHLPANQAPPGVTRPDS
ncbi:Dermonecrotic toxin [compost metagenome]